MAARNRTRPKPTSHPSKRVAIYARRSKEDRDKTASLPEQIEACRRYAEERGWGEIVRVEGENRSGVSGFDRPVFQRLIKAAEAGSNALRAAAGKLSTEARLNARRVEDEGGAPRLQPRERIRSSCRLGFRGKSEVKR